MFVLVGQWTTTHDVTRLPASFDYRIYIQHINKPLLVSNLIFFKLFGFFSRNFKMRGSGNHDDRHRHHHHHHQHRRNDDDQV
jgi:hypothetical protein